jgi:hypothetical protein
VPVAYVSDTARWVAGYHDIETPRPEILVGDPFAEMR